MESSGFPSLNRIPSLSYRAKIRGYSGLYTINKQDGHPIVGATELQGFWLAAGFSGHGFKLAPAVGALIARQLTGERTVFDSDVSTEFLAPQREPLTGATHSALAWGLGSEFTEWYYRPIRG